MKIKSILMIDDALSGIELNNTNIPIFKQGGMITEFKDLNINSIDLEDGT